MKYTSRLPLLLLAFMVAMLVFPAMASAETVAPDGTTSLSPTIQSDKADYAPGELVTLTGGNWQPGESVNIKVNDTYGATWSRNVDVTADSSGNVTDSFNLPNTFVSDYDVTATGAQSGTATTTFTDGNVAVSGTVKDSVTGLPISGATVTCNTSTGCNATFTDTTDASGNYSFTQAEGNRLSFDTNGPVTLNLTVSKTGYTAGTITLTNVNNNTQRTGQNISLTPSCTAASVATSPSTQTVTYGQNATFTATGGGSPAPTVQWQKSTDNGATWNNVSGATSSPLTVTKPSVSDSGNHYRAVFTNSCDGTQTATSNAATLNVNKKSLTVSATGQNKVYDGNTSASVTLSDNRVSGDTLTTSYTNASFANKVVGTGKAVNVSGISISGADAGNYSFNTTATASADITKRNLTVSATADNKVYDGTTAATAHLSTNDKVSGDTVTLAYTSATFGDKDVGTGKTVSVTGISISGGADAGNYNLTNTTASTTADITKRALTVSAAGQNKVYDGNTSATVNLSTNKLTGDTVTASYTNA
jgi:hypothetical protein